MNELGKRENIRKNQSVALTFKEATVDRLPLRTRKRRRRKLRKGNRSGVRALRDDSNFVNNVEKKNETFETYYKAQGIVGEDEMSELLRALREPLPTSFRITTSGGMAEEVKRKVRGEFRELFESVKDEHGSVIIPPEPLSWYPGDLAWSVNAPRQLLRRDNALSKFHKYLITMNNLGAINRQEAVSMIPPLLLHIQPGLSVIDMCAAPGSKTAQILDMIVSGQDLPGKLTRNGLVVANDSDLKRAWMLAHQIKRFSSPEAVITHHEAQNFPAVTLFDRVLCDVPCSGDGTLRKAPDLWRKWTPEMGNGLHRIQKRILQRGIDLLKPGGRLVYSTCSMNPVENEAVVADALRTFGPHELELLNVSEALPGLKRRPGLRHWRVKDTSETDAWFSDFPHVPHRRTNKVVKSLFPPSDEEDFPLERCMRLVPQDQNTGAFFVAVIIKKNCESVNMRPCEIQSHKGRNEKLDKAGEISHPQGEGMPKGVRRIKLGMTTEDDSKMEEQSSREASESGDPVEPPAECGTAQDQGNQKLRSESAEEDKTRSISKQRIKDGRSASRLLTDDPLVPLKDFNPEVLDNISEFYGLEPEDCRICMMCRETDISKFKKILIVSKQVRELLRYSIGSPEGSRIGYRGVLRVVHAGVRVFERTTRRDTACGFRVVFDGLRVVIPSMKQRLVSVERRDLARVLHQDSIPLTSLGSREARAALMRLRSGPTVLAIDPPVGDAVIVWKSAHTIAKLMPLEETGALKDKYGMLEEGRMTKGNAIRKN